MLVTQSGNLAKQTIREVSELRDNPFTQLWLNETYPVFCVIRYDTTNTYPLCLALLHKVDFDPLRIFEKPLLLDYIYTPKKYRNNGHASYLVRKITKKNKIIGFCCNEEAVNMFIKNGFSYDPQNEMVRYPPLLDTSPKNSIMEELIEGVKDQELLEESNDPRYVPGKKMVYNLLLDEARKFLGHSV